MVTQQRITRSIEDLLYKKLLEGGYLPDRELYAGNESGYQDEEAAIRNTKGFCVSLFGHGVSHDRGIKSVPSISILALGFVGGSVGNDSNPHYVETPDGTSYSKVLGAPASSTFRFEVALTSNKSSQDNLLEQVRFSSIPPRTYIPFYDDLESHMLVVYNFVRQNPDFGHGLIQKIYLYEVVDIFEQDTISEIGEITKIKEIEVRDDDTDNITTIK